MLVRHGGILAINRRAGYLSAMSAEAHTHILTAARKLSPDLAKRIRALGPLVIPEREDRGPAHFLSRAVVGQQLSTKVARVIWSRVEEAAGTSGVPDFFTLKSTDRLRACGVSNGKIKALNAIREAQAAGLLEAKHLRGLDHPTRAEHLTAIHGVGPWTADMVSIFYCRDPDVWPDGDGAVIRAFRPYIGRKKTARAAAPFAPYRTYLALYMWRLLDAQP
jgi:DNA-3-methyladenine glycosylase II